MSTEDWGAPFREAVVKAAQGIADVIPQVDRMLTQAGQRMADDVEAWLREETR